MNWMLPYQTEPFEPKVSYPQHILMMGSCFSENIGQKLAEAKFKVLPNPMGIVFDPLSLARHLADVTNGKVYTDADLFEYNELWSSWNHHSNFSQPTATQTLEAINTAITQTRAWLKQTSHVFITLGTAYHYRLQATYQAVANNHKAPAAWFTKHLLSIEEMVQVLNGAITDLKQQFPQIQVVVTVSPVKHLRDGLIENSRSKARLLEVAHQLNDTLYFPAYELVNEVLRDYRFYTPDMAHPNEQAILFVFEQFYQSWMTAETLQLMGEVKQIVSARNHKVLHPGTQAHQKFKQQLLAQTLALQAKLPMLNWEEELRYFTAG